MILNILLSIFIDVLTISVSHLAKIINKNKNYTYRSSKCFRFTYQNVLLKTELCHKLDSGCTSFMIIFVYSLSYR